MSLAEMRTARSAKAWHLEALEEGSEIAATQFADWMADEEQRDDLHDLLSYLAEHELVKQLAERWASQA